MAKSGRVRRRGMKVAGQAARRDREALRAALRTVMRPPRPDGDVTVQLLPHHLEAGELPRVEVGEELEVAPVVYAGPAYPAPGGPDEWALDEFGTFEACGQVLSAPVDLGSCGCQVDVLDVAGQLFPLNWAASEPTDGRVRLQGALYLDPELAAGTDHGDAVSLCRRRYRVRAVRRYVRTAMRPVHPVELTAVPGPDEVDEERVYVADLVAVPVDGPGDVPG